MKIARFRTPALSALAVLLISGAGIAFAGNSAPAAAPASVPAVAPAPSADPSVDPSTEPVNPATEPANAAEPAGAETDTLQQGDQTTPDTAAEGTGTEAAGVEEPGDANLPGGGHADNPNDPNADHQFEGVE